MKQMANKWQNVILFSFIHQLLFFEHFIFLFLSNQHTSDTKFKRDREEESVEKGNKQAAERKRDGEAKESYSNSMCWISPADMW